METSKNLTKGKRLLLLLWAALVSFLIVDPLASTGVGRKGIELWNRHTHNLKSRDSHRHTRK